jgi:hypothetical protein
VRRSYRGLPYQVQVEQMVSGAVERCHSPWLVDVLMLFFLSTLEKLNWNKKVIFRGPSVQRRCHPTESEFLLDLCIESGCDRLLLGRGQQMNLHQKMFRRNEIGLMSQRWEGSKYLPPRDSILDLMARYSTEDINTHLTKQ